MIERWRYVPLDLGPFGCPSQTRLRFPLTFVLSPLHEYYLYLVVLEIRDRTGKDKVNKVQ